MGILRIFVGVVVFSVCSVANTITFTQTGTGSGMIGTTSFTDTQFKITDIGDTTDVQTFSGGSFINVTTATIDISGLGTFDITTPTRTFVNNFVEVVGFSRAGSTGADLYDGPDNSAFSTWNMLTSIGPISGTGNLLPQWAFPPVDTNGGVLTFDNGFSDTVFTATVEPTATPEPSYLAFLFILSVTLVALVRRRRNPSWQD